MVKPHEEEQAGRLNEREIKTLFTIFSRRIVDTYKQFKWGVDIFEREGEAQIAFQILTSNNVLETWVTIHIRYLKDGTLEVKLSGKSPEKWKQGFTQTFPVTGKSPRELGRLANNMFKWVKQQMEKI